MHNQIRNSPCNGRRCCALWCGCGGDGVGDGGAVTADEAVRADIDCGSVGEIKLAECKALLALYDSTNGPQWTVQTGWLQTTTPCSWHGVSCYLGYVNALILSENGLTGSLPQEMADLTNLESLNLGYNGLSGPIPPELGSLARLEGLVLSGNGFSGAFRRSWAI